MTGSEEREEGDNKANGRQKQRQREKERSGAMPGNTLYRRSNPRTSQESDPLDSPAPPSSLRFLMATYPQGVRRYRSTRSGTNSLSNGLSFGGRREVWLRDTRVDPQSACHPQEAVASSAPNPRPPFSPDDASCARSMPIHGDIRSHSIPSFVKREANVVRQRTFLEIGEVLNALHTATRSDN